MSHYDAYGPHWYDDYWTKKGTDGCLLYHHWIARRLLEIGGYVLDVGCGVGELPVLVKHTSDSCTFHGVDFSKVAVESYRAKGNQATQCFAEDLPFGDNSWPTVVCTETLEHTESPKVVLDELRRVCRGKLFITVPPEVQGRTCTQHKWKIGADEWAELLGLPPHTWTGTAQIGWEL